MPQIGLIELDEQKAYMLPYAPAIEVPPGAELVFLSGVTAIGPTASTASESVREQTLAMLANAASVLASAGTDWSNVIHIYEFVTDMREADLVHAAMGEYFVGNGMDSKPANTLIGVNALER
ncbi:MAG: RidA family protein, partial [Microbacterium sp.]